jgi:hypothetical protein
MKKLFGKIFVVSGFSLSSLVAQEDSKEWRVETAQEQAQLRALLKDRERVIFDSDGDGWDDLWYILQVKSRGQENSGIINRPHLDDDGDGFTNREEMLLFRNPFQKEMVITAKGLAAQKVAQKLYAERANREKLREMLPLIEKGMMTARAAKPATISEAQADPEGKRKRLLDTAEAILKREKQEKQRVVKSLSKEAIDILGGDENVELLLRGASGGLLELEGSDNLNSARTVGTDNVWPGGSSEAPDLDGEGQLIGIWEAGGGVFGRHVEFLDGGASRVDQVDDPGVEVGNAAFRTLAQGVFSNHATQVAGVLASAGSNEADSRGMAFAAVLAAYGSAGDIAEMMAAGATGLQLSNHSYSRRFGWLRLGNSWFWLGPDDDGEDPRFGLYTQQSREIDIVAYENPYYLSLWSSGNEGTDIGPVNSTGVIPAGTQYTRVHDDDQDGNFTAETVTTNHPPDSGDPLPGATPIFFTGIGFRPVGIASDTLKSAAKNNLMVGAVDDLVNGYTQASDVDLATFSGRGPTDDGRVKPDLVANGVSFTSTHFVLGAPQAIGNGSFELPSLNPGQESNNLTGWTEDNPGTSAAQIAFIENFASEGDQVARINTVNYRIWQDLTGVTLSANTQYVLSLSLGKLTGTSTDENQVRVSVFTNGFANLLVEQVFEPGELTPLTIFPGEFGTFQTEFFVGAPVPAGTVRVVIENLGTGSAFVDFVRLNEVETDLYTDGIDAGSVSGTSFSTPSVTGSLALLQQANEDFGNGPLLSSTWKALLINTADDGDRLPTLYEDTDGGTPNLYPGPDYFFGWGLLNTTRAAETLDANQQTASKRTHLREHTLFNGNAVEVLVEVGPNTPSIQATMSWIDPSYQSVNTASEVDENLPPVLIDQATSMLINDLDLEIVRPAGGAPVQAWRLDPAAPRAEATQGDNTVDNVEQVTVEPVSGNFLTPGTYKFIISHKGSLRRSEQTTANPPRYQLLTGEYQTFSLAIAGNVERDGDLFEVTGIDRMTTPTNVLVPLTWESVKGLRHRVQRSLDLQTWSDLPGDLDATGETTTTTITEALGLDKVFYRVIEVRL